MMSNKIVLSVCCAAILALSACSRQQSDWQKTRETNTTEAYEQFLKKYPTGEFTTQAQARVKDLYEERDWQKARDTDSPEAYQAFLKQYPEGKWTEEARIRVENFTLAQAPGTATAAPGATDAGTHAMGTPSPPSAAPGADSANDTSPAEPAAPVSKGPARATAGETAPPATDAMPTPKTNKAAKTNVTAQTGSFGIQLGAFKSGAGAAHARWAHLQKEYPSLLAGLTSKVVAKKAASGKLFRLQATGLTEKRARAVCTSLKSKSQPCVVVPPSHG